MTSPKSMAMNHVWDTPWVLSWSQLLVDSYQHWLGRELIERQGSVEEQARRLFHAPFVVVSHGTQADPILNYGNQVALELWEMDWDQLTQIPSRLTAEPVNRAEREQMLLKAASQGFIDDYQGVRISRTGRRFYVEQAIVWNVIDSSGTKHGQAATFASWSFLAGG